MEIAIKIFRKTVSSAGFSVTFTVT